MQNARTDEEFNALGQPIGASVPGWKPADWPGREPMEGRFCRLVPLDPALHAEPLFNANAMDREGRLWTYLYIGPFSTLESYRAWMESVTAAKDPLFYAIIDRATDSAVGVASYLRLDPQHGVLEVGNLCFSPLLQRTPAATEAMYLMMERAFGLGYRRYEWKCNALNIPSRKAALRLGFTFEGIFRQAAVVKGRNRDTAWYSLIDREWPALKSAFQSWLDPANFDEQGQQKKRLSDSIHPVLNPKT